MSAALKRAAAFAMYGPRVLPKFVRFAPLRVLIVVVHVRFWLGVL